MIPLNVNPDVPHLPGYECCLRVRDAVASAALEGASFDDDWVRTLHDVAVGRRSSTDVVDELLRAYGR